MVAPRLSLSYAPMVLQPLCFMSTFLAWGVSLFSFRSLQFQQQAIDFSLLSLDSLGQISINIFAGPFESGICIPWRDASWETTAASSVFPPATYLRKVKLLHGAGNC